MLLERLAEQDGMRVRPAVAAPGQEDAVWDAVPQRRVRLLSENVVAVISSLDGAGPGAELAEVVRVVPHGDHPLLIR